MSAFPPPVGGKGRNRFVGFGLAMVVLGWVTLVADLLLGDALLQAGSLVAVLSLKSDIATIAQTLVVTGLGLAILGGLREGFGALNRFFDAVMRRSTAPRPAPMPDPTPAAPEVVAVVPQAGERAAGERAAPPGRNYVILPDGSVEVETLLGTRIFASVEEARHFMR